ncbi:MaoC/PaaZ C-terminal domain-containing protein [soil metagenome]
MKPHQISVSKTVSESDVYLFAGITGDFSPNHVDEDYMSRTAFGHRIAHGALLVGYMSRASTMIVETGLSLGPDMTPVSLGYDRVRFLKPVFIGDTITVNYVVTGIDNAKARSEAKVEVTNQHDETVAVATHIMKWVRNPAHP